MKKMELEDIPKDFNPKYIELEDIPKDFKPLGDPIKIGRDFMSEPIRKRAAVRAGVCCGQIPSDNNEDIFYRFFKDYVEFYKKSS